MHKSSIIVAPPGDFSREDVYARQRWKRVQQLTNEFWTRWRREYLQTLQTRARSWTKEKLNLQVGDIVMLKEEEMVRGRWRLGRILETIPSKDNLVRKCLRKKNPTILERPIHKLVLLLSC
ncbi:hypothetical protein HOLleu_38743 [Holothuria leucospilota]|uniref:DUF5641 domain-containing protein n=1 Tax=Holothuria leucospilota TaxID=206669 RepID=A0A9Q0YHG5_HOLLE|nr:hypothetical protein HOLleu_38743 [Holothuria leucospilota]